MAAHQMFSFFHLAGLSTTGKIMKIPYGSSGDTKHYLRWGTGAPTGTPDAFLYIRIDPANEDQVLYVNDGGSWTAANL